MADRELKIKVTAGVKPLKDLQAELRKSKEDLARLELQGKANTKEYKEQAQYVHALNAQYKQLQPSSKDAAQGIDYRQAANKRLLAWTMQAKALQNFQQS